MRVIVSLQCSAVHGIYAIVARRLRLLNPQVKRAEWAGRLVLLFTLLVNVSAIGSRGFGVVVRCS